MASKAFKRVVLLSIQPQFARAIMKGEKKAEFRRKIFSEQVSHVVVYASRPIQRVLGYFEVSRIDRDSPEKLWIRYGAVGEISHEDFQTYYSSSASGTAIMIGKVVTLRNPLPLSILDDSLTAPQSFTYLRSEALEMIQEYA